MIRLALNFPKSYGNGYEDIIWWYCGEDDLRTKIKYTRHEDKATEFSSVERAEHFAKNLIKKHSTKPQFWIYTENDKIMVK